MHEPEHDNVDSGVDLDARQRSAAPSGADDAFDRLLQEHIARSSDLMRQALALQIQTEHEVARARAEADRRLDQERRQHRAVLTAVAVEVAELRTALDRLTQRIDDALAGPTPTQPRMPAPPTSVADDLLNEDFAVADEAGARTEAALGSASGAADADHDQTPAELSSAAVGGEPHQVSVLVHGVPRAAAALSLQRHLASLGHVEGVEAREFAEGILRLQVTARHPLALDDLRSWEGGAGLEPVHVLAEVIEVRLPGAAGF